MPTQIGISMLILVECKDYSSPVPVNEVEEFWAKIQQVTGANVKGVLASTNAFQAGTLAFAKSKGFALLRHFGNDSFKYELTRSPSVFALSSHFPDVTESRKALTQTSFKSRFFDLYGFANGSYTHSTNGLFECLCAERDSGLDGKQIGALVNPSKERRSMVRYRPKDEIEAEARAVLDQIEYVDGPVELTAVCDWQRVERDLVTQTDVLNPYEPSVLASLTFSPLVIKIYRTEQSNQYRERFTLAHELGHLFLNHQEYIVRERTEESDLDTDGIRALPFKDLTRLEWQANYFASCLLLPMDNFISRFFELAHDLGIRDRGFGVLYVDEQPINQRSYYVLTNQLREAFKVSRQPIKFRLDGLGFLKEVRAERPVHQIAHGLFSDEY